VRSLFKSASGKCPATSGHVRGSRKSFKRKRNSYHLEVYHQPFHIVHVHDDDDDDDGDVPARLDRQEVLDQPLLLVVGVVEPHDSSAEIRRCHANLAWVRLS
jgi:hypothetical protein